MRTLILPPWSPIIFTAASALTTVILDGIVSHVLLVVRRPGADKIHG